MDGFNTFEKQDRILVGMSGGVDSSVTVRILQEQGFSVEGAVIRFSPAHETAVSAAQETAKALQIPLHVIDASTAFEQNVILPFCKSYCAGQTPNPCILCNPTVKFRLLAEKATELNCPFIATGHYARVQVGEDGISRIAVPESAARDQSYMLYRLPQEILSRLVLPLGEFEKPEIREMARALQLACADAPDSMEICFIPDGDYSAYIRAHGFVPKSGHFIGPDGEDLGEHAGVDHYTVGQRKGLGISVGRPLFVKAILSDGSIQLAETGQEYSNRLSLRDMVTPDGNPLPAGEYMVKIRSAATPTRCIYDGASGVDFPEPVRAPAPGQSAVFYREGTVYGGGIIQETF